MRPSRLLLSGLASTGLSACTPEYFTARECGPQERAELYMMSDLLVESMEGDDLMIRPSVQRIMGGIRRMTIGLDGDVACADKGADWFPGLSTAAYHSSKDDLIVFPLLNSTGLDQGNDHPLSCDYINIPGGNESFLRQQAFEWWIREHVQVQQDGHAESYSKFIQLRELLEERRDCGFFAAGSFFHEWGHHVEGWQHAECVADIQTVNEAERKSESGECPVYDDYLYRLDDEVHWRVWEAFRQSRTDSITDSYNYYADDCPLAGVDFFDDYSPEEFQANNVELTVIDYMVAQLMAEGMSEDDAYGEAIQYVQDTDLGKKLYDYEEGVVSDTYFEGTSKCKYNAIFDLWQENRVLYESGFQVHIDQILDERMPNTGLYDPAEHFCYPVEGNPSTWTYEYITGGVCSA